MRKKIYETSGAAGATWGSVVLWTHTHKKKKKEASKINILFSKFWVYFLFTLGQGEGISHIILSLQRILNLSVTNEQKGNG